MYPFFQIPKRRIEEAFSNPINSPTLEEIIREKGKPTGEMSVAIAVSDITRPVPYKGESGILPPLLRRLESSGIKKEKVKIIVATGMHRPSTYEEKKEMYGEEVVEQYAISDHDCENNDLLTKYWKDEKGDPCLRQPGLLFRGPEDCYRSCREPFFHRYLRRKEGGLSGIGRCEDDSEVPRAPLS